MVNRTANVIQLADYDALNQDKQESKARRTAYLGDGNGNFEVAANGSSNDHYGKMWIRFLEGASYGQAVEAYVNPNANITHKPNLPVLVYIHRPSQQWVIDSVDIIRANKANYNTHLLNALSPRLQLLWLRQIQDGKLFAPATSTVDALTVSVQPFLFTFDGSIYNGGKANNIDLTAYMPSTGNECLIIVGERANDRTIQIVSGGTRTITSTKYALSDIATLIADFDDYVIPLQAVKLTDNAATVLEKDLHQDLRQFINVQQPRGTPTGITRHIMYLEGYHDNVIGGVEISGSGSLEIELGGSFIIQ